jgi:hypothetical protein
VNLRGVALFAAGTSVAQIAHANGSKTDDITEVELWADQDDDDADGRPDGEQTELGVAARMDLVPVESRWTLRRWYAVAGGEHCRVMTETGPLPWGNVVPRRAWLQGVSPGYTELRLEGGLEAVRLHIDVRGVEWRITGGALVDPARSHVSLDRTPPSRVDAGALRADDDPDAVRVVVARWGESLGEDVSRAVSLESLGALGARLDVLSSLALSPSTCGPGDVGMRCWTSAPLRLVADTVDRDNPLASERSLLAQVGGALVVRWRGQKAQMIRVLGPRTTEVGPIDRLRATLRPFVVRLTPGGSPAIGGTDTGAIQAMKAELASAAAIWGQCGVTFGDERGWTISVVDPPPSHLVSVGDDLGIPASGGVVVMRVGNQRILLTTFPGERPDRVARELVQAAQRAGLTALALPNARIGPGVDASVDVSIRKRDGTPVAVDVVPGVPLSTDPTLSVRIGSVDLADGLEHFSDTNAVAGTLEERTLVKAFDDGDPTTIEVIVVPLFSGSGRLGESFIGSDLSSLRNVVLLDRAGVRATGSSYTLPHELGHVLMDLPGHPDDYVVDTPTSLMDSDASDASAFGPRRLSLDDCARVVRQSGPGARVPLLSAWPVGPLPIRKTSSR